MATQITKRTNISNLQKPLGQDNLKDCFQQISTSQAKISDAMGKLVASIFSAYKMNMWKNDRNLKLHSSYLLLKKIADQDGTFVKALRSGIQNGWTKIGEKIVELVKKSANDNTVKHLTDKQALEIANAIVGTVSVMIDSYIKENPISVKNEETSDISANDVYLRMKSNKANSILVDKDNIGDFQDAEFRLLEQTILNTEKGISNSRMSFVNSLNTIKTALDGLKSTFGKDTNPINGSRNLHNLKNIQTITNDVIQKTDSVNLFASKLGHIMRNDMLGSGTRLVKVILNMAKQHIKINFIDNDYSFKNLKRRKSISKQIEEMSEWRIKPWKKLGQLLKKTLYKAFDFFIIMPLRLVPYCGQVIDQIRELGRNIQKAGLLSAGSSILFGSAFGYLTFVAQMPNIIFGFAKGLYGIVANSLPVRILKGAFGAFWGFAKKATNMLLGIVRKVTTPSAQMFLKTLIAIFSSSSAAWMLGFVSGFFIGKIRKTYKWIVNLFSDKIRQDAKITIGDVEISREGIKIGNENLTKDFIVDKLQKMGEDITVKTENVLKSWQGYLKEIDFRHLKGEAKHKGYQLFELLEQGLQSFTIGGITRRGGEYIIGSLAGLGAQHPVKAFKYLKSSAKWLVANPWVIAGVLLATAGVMWYNIFKDWQAEKEEQGRAKRGFGQKRAQDQLPTKIGMMMAPRGFMSDITQRWAKQNIDQLGGGSEVSNSIRDMIQRSLNNQNNFENMRDFLQEESRNLIAERDSIMSARGDNKVSKYFTYKVPQKNGEKISFVNKVVGNNPISFRIRYLMYRSKKFNEFVNNLQSGKFSDIDSSGPGGKEQLKYKYYESLAIGTQPSEIQAVKLYDGEKQESKKSDEEIQKIWNDTSIEGEHARESLVNWSTGKYLKPSGGFAIQRHDYIYGLMPMVAIYLEGKMTITQTKCDLQPLVFDIVKSSKFQKEYIVPNLKELSKNEKEKNKKLIDSYANNPNVNQSNVVKILDIVSHDQKIIENIRGLAKECVNKCNFYDFNSKITPIRVDNPKSNKDLYFVFYPLTEDSMKHTMFFEYESRKFELGDLDKVSRYDGAGKKASGPSFYSYAKIMNFDDSGMRKYFVQNSSFQNSNFEQFLDSISKIFLKYIVYAITELSEKQQNLSTVDAGLGTFDAAMSGIQKIVQNNAKTLADAAKRQLDFSEERISADNQQFESLKVEFNSQVNDLTDSVHKTVNLLSGICENYLGQEVVDKVKEIKNKFFVPSDDDGALIAAQMTNTRMELNSKAFNASFSSSVRNQLPLAASAPISRSNAFDYSEMLPPTQPQDIPPYKPVQIQPQQTNIPFFGGYTLPYYP